MLQLIRYICLYVQKFTKTVTVLRTARFRSDRQCGAESPAARDPRLFRFQRFTRSNLSLISSDLKVVIDPGSHAPFTSTSSKPATAAPSQPVAFSSAADYIDGNQSLIPFINFLIATPGPSGSHAPASANAAFASALPFFRSQ